MRPFSVLAYSRRRASRRVANTVTATDDEDVAVAAASIVSDPDVGDLRNGIILAVDSVTKAWTDRVKTRRLKRQLFQEMHGLTVTDPVTSTPLLSHWQTAVEAEGKVMPTVVRALWSDPDGLTQTQRRVLDQMIPGMSYRCRDLRTGWHIMQQLQALGKVELVDSSVIDPLEKRWRRIVA